MGRSAHRRGPWPDRSRRCAKVPPMNPGHRATVLVTFAATGGIPSAVITGKEISVPPPATALTAPAASAATPKVR